MEIIFKGHANRFPAAVSGRDCGGEGGVGHLLGHLLILLLQKVSHHCPLPSLWNLETGEGWGLSLDIVYTALVTKD